MSILFLERLINELGNEYPFLIPLCFFVQNAYIFLAEASFKCRNLSVI